MYKTPALKKFLISLIPNIKLLGTTPLGGKFYYRARTHKSFLFNRIMLAKHEIAIFDYYQKYLNSDSIFYDVGANIGVHTVAASTKINPGKGRIFSVEPDPENQNLLRENIVLNGLTSYCSILPFAVSSTSGKLTFKRDIVSSATGRLAIVGSNSSQHNWVGLAPLEITVDCITLDEIVFQKMLPPPDLIKVDVEGAEFLVLQGAQRLLQTYKPNIIFDGMDMHCFELLCDAGYFLYDMLGDMKFVNNINNLSFTMLATKRSPSDFK